MLTQIDVTDFIMFCFPGIEYAMEKDTGKCMISPVSLGPDNVRDENVNHTNYITMAHGRDLFKMSRYELSYQGKVRP